MKRLLLLMLGFGAVSVAACNSPETAEVQNTSTTLALSGMT